MRKFFIVSAFVTMAVAVSSSAVANYVYPGRVIIGYGGGGGGGGGTTTGGTTTNAANLAPLPGGCVLPKEIECECFKGTSLIDACIKSGVTLDCLGPETPYAELIQKEPVLIQGEKKTLGALLCSGDSNATAWVNLPLPKG